MRKTNDIINSWLDFNQDSEAPKSYIKWSAISMICACAKRKIRLQWGTMEWFPNFYIILVGPPAARKGSAISPVTNMLLDLNVPLCGESITAEKFINRLSESLSSCQWPGANGAAYSHCSLSLISPELSVTLNKRENAQHLINTLTDLFDSPKRWVYETKTSGTDEIIGGWVNMLGATTPALMSNTVPISAVGSGYASRVIFVCERAGGVRVPVPRFPRTKEGITLWENIKHDLDEILETAGDVTTSAGFIAAYEKWYTEMTPECHFAPQRFNYYWARRPMHLMKLSMVMALSESCDLVLRKNHFDRALRFLKAAEKNMPQAFNMVGDNNYAPYVEEILNLILTRGEITYGELMALYIKDLSDYELDRIIQSCQTSGFVDVISTSTGKKLRASPECIAEFS